MPTQNNFSQGPPPFGTGYPPNEMFSNGVLIHQTKLYAADLTDWLTRHIDSLGFLPQTKNLLRAFVSIQFDKNSVLALNTEEHLKNRLLEFRIALTILVSGVPRLDQERAEFAMLRTMLPAYFLDYVSRSLGGTERNYQDLIQRYGSLQKQNTPETTPSSPTLGNTLGNLFG